MTYGSTSVAGRTTLTLPSPYEGEWRFTADVAAVTLSVATDTGTRALHGAAMFGHLVVDRKSTRLNSSHSDRSRMPSSA